MSAAPLRRPMPAPRAKVLAPTRVFLVFERADAASGSPAVLLGEIASTDSTSAEHAWALAHGMTYLERRSLVARPKPEGA